MFSKKLVGTIGVLSATALAPATAAHAAPSPAPTEAAHVVDLGTQVGSEGIRSPQADGIIAVLIGLAVSPAGEPPKGRLVQGRPGGRSWLPRWPAHPPVDVTTRPAGVATDGSVSVPAAQRRRALRDRADEPGVPEHLLTPMTLRRR